MTRFSPPTRGLAGISLAVALAVAAGPILATAHLTAVKHVVCPQDGELVEVHFGSVHATPKSRAATQGSFRRGGAQSTESEHGHEHCTFATHSLPRSVANSQIPLLTVAPAVPTASVSRDRCIDAVTADVYRIAPKTSPPAV